MKNSELNLCRTNITCDGKIKMRVKFECILNIKESDFKLSAISIYSLHFT